MKIETAIDIQAPPATVWAHLSDLESYPDWNPFTVRVKGTLAMGEALNLKVELGGKTFWRTHVVSRLSPEEALCWTIQSDQEWFIRGERCQFLEAIEGGCRYRNIESVHGMIAPTTPTGTRSV